MPLHSKPRFDIRLWTIVQASLRDRLIVETLADLPRFVAGADCSFSRPSSRVHAAAVVYDKIDRVIVARTHLTEECTVPYIPGYLSFREAPALLRLLADLRHKRPFEALLIDGQGYAHPRRCGIATHIGVELDLPTVGVAKSRLIGTHDEVGSSVGSFVPLIDKSEPIGIVLRTRANVRPLFVSIGHRIDLESARRLVLSCLDRHRLPTPTREADREAAILKQRIG
jgi:deoxyribonuclease V